MTKFKVLLERNNVLTSSFVNTKMCQVDYILGEWATAPVKLAELGYHLMVFESLEDAWAFLASIIQLYQIWEVEVKDQVPLPERRCIFPPKDLESLYTSDADDKWGKGAKMYKSVKLIRRVDNA